MRQFDAFENLYFIAFAGRKKRRRVFAGAVPGNDRRRFKRRDEKCRSRVRLMMFDKVKLKIARAEVFAQTLRVFEHSQITFADLRDTAIRRALNIAGEINPVFNACIALCRKIQGFQ